ncbi:hypothetical protein GHT06_018081 [Daphnia sinensis]|uniref:Uncharacterized protein n=1 Tax=Daphnia sinensis TaxID=1820382 RepID=A0AAD5KM14_9CRUS|nr:hypothetical protein GHT06_018081 [Daphnia sinensis]
MSTVARSRIRTDCMATGIGSGYECPQLTLIGWIPATIRPIFCGDLSLAPPGYVPRVFQTLVWCVAGPWISREPAWPRRVAPTDLPTEKETWLRRSTHVFSNQPATTDLTLDDASSQQPSHPVSSKSTTTKVLWETRLHVNHRRRVEQCVEAGVALQLLTAVPTRVRVEKTCPVQLSAGWQTAALHPERVRKKKRKKSACTQWMEG